jgi:NAD(P)-dependent dehydrogenase (short-subunit alcohol dehydrogenase family)
MVPDKLITADCHIAPPYELINELPESYREYFPRIEKDENGKDVFKAGHIVTMAMMTGESVDSDITADATGAVGNVVAEAHPSFDAAEQLADLERDGVYGAVLIGRISDMPNAIPADADTAYCKIVNDWLAETWGPYLDRVAPGIHLPFEDVPACVAELERAAGMGLRPALLPDGIFERPYYMEEWEPLWEAADSLRIPITMHVGGLRSPLVGPGLMAYPGRQDIGWYMQCCGMGETLGWLTYSGVFENAFHFNVSTPFELTRLAIPHMLERPGGSIINIGSMAGLMAERGFISYSLSKSALGQLTRLLAVELAPRIRVNAVFPGATETDAFRGFLDMAPHVRESMYAKTPMRRNGTPADIAAAVTFFASRHPRG